MKAPKPANPVATAAAQTSQNTMAANANTYAQSGSVTNPYGTRSSALESMDIINPLTGKPEKVLRNNVTETLTPEQQAIFNQNQASDLNLATYGKDQTQELLKLGAKPFDYTTGDHEAWFAKNYDTLNNDKNAQSDEALRSRLAAQGIRLGSAAYDREMKSQSAGQNDARLQALINAQQQGYQQSLASRNQRFNEPLAISSGTQLQMPNFNGANVGNVATTDYAGIRSNYDNQRMARYQANQGVLGGLFSGLGTAFAMSEPSEKKDKVKLPAKAPTGLQLWSYRYKDEPKTAPKRVGVMANEAEKKMPHAVMRGADGKRRVNMGMALGY